MFYQTKNSTCISGIILQYFKHDVFREAFTFCQNDPSPIFYYFILLCHAFKCLNNTVTSDIYPLTKSRNYPINLKYFTALFRVLLVPLEKGEGFLDHKRELIFFCNVHSNVQRQSGELTLNPSGIEMRKIRYILINKLETDASLNSNQSQLKTFSVKSRLSRFCSRTYHDTFLTAFLIVKIRNMYADTLL